MAFTPVDYIASYFGWNQFTPALPNFYWDVYSAEERVKKICFELDKLCNYANMLADNINIDHNLITELQNALANIETLPEIDAKVIELQRTADAIETLLENIPNYGEFSDLADEVENVVENLDTKLPWPVAPYSRFGTNGHVLRTNGDGTTQWQAPVIPTDIQAQTYIAEWLDEHPEATTSVQDRSITGLKIALDTINDENFAPDCALFQTIEVSQNIFNPSDVIDNSFVNQAGVIASRTGCYRTDYIPVVAGETYAHFETGMNTNIYFALYNINQEFVSRQNIGTTYTYTIPSNISYIIICTYDQAFSPDFTVVKSTERIYEYYPHYVIKNIALKTSYDTSLSIDNMIAPAKTVGDYIRQILLPSGNLFDPTAITTNAFYGANGNYVQDNGSNLSDFIEVEIDELYSYVTSTTLYINTFDANRTWVSRSLANTGTITIPSNVKYVRFGMYHSEFADNFNFVKGTLPSYLYPTIYKINPALLPPTEPEYDNSVIVEMHDGFFYHYHKNGDGYLRYKFNHFVDATSNADGWVQREVALVTSDLSTVIMPVVTYGEWEMAVQLKDRPDFIGCQNHGSEVTSIVNFYFDGIKQSISDGTTLNCNEIKILEKSTMYDPLDETTIVGYHYKVYTITHNNMQIEQRIEWVIDVIANASYCGMLPMVRGNDTTTQIQVTDTAYDDLNMVECDVSTTTFVPNDVGVHNNKGNTLCIYGAISGISASLTCEIENQPASSFSFLSNAAGYNKWYYAYCDVNYPISSGDVWKWISKYNITYKS